MRSPRLLQQHVRDKARHSADSARSPPRLRAKPIRRALGCSVAPGISVSLGDPWPCGPAPIASFSGFRWRCVEYVPPARAPGGSRHKSGRPVSENWAAFLPGLVMIGICRREGRGLGHSWSARNRPPGPPRAAATSPRAAIGRERRPRFDRPLVEREISVPNSEPLRSPPARSKLAWHRVDRSNSPFETLMAVPSAHPFLVRHAPPAEKAEILSSATGVQRHPADPRPRSRSANAPLRRGGLASSVISTPGRKTPGASALLSTLRPSPSHQGWVPPPKKMTSPSASVPASFVFKIARRACLKKNDPAPSRPWLLSRNRHFEAVKGH